MRRAAAALAATLALLAACGPPAGPAAPSAAAIPIGSAPPPQAAAPSTHELGRAVYNFRCYFCHGYSGDAKTLAATYLWPPPRDFTAAAAQALDVATVRQAARDGRSGTAMRPFANVLSEAELDAVAAFVRHEFIDRKAPNTRYHTTANGWPEHQRYEAAFPFATGRIALDKPVETLSEREQQGRQLYVSACVTCHDRARVTDEGPAWSARPVSYPRAGFQPGEATPPVDAVSSASVYAKHDVVPQIEGLTHAERRGERLFQSNCAFCHGADGTGKNWIGQFMEPKARDLTQYTAQTLPPARLRQVIRDGLPGTSMPAWRHVLAPREVDELAQYVQRAFYVTRTSSR